MNVLIRDKLINHYRTFKGNENIPEELMEEYIEAITLESQIFYCETCHINIFETPIKSCSSEKQFSHPKCGLCNKDMIRVVINDVTDDSQVTEFLRKPRPKIYCFLSDFNLTNEPNSEVNNNRVLVISLDEKGNELISHTSFSKYYAKVDIGLISNSYHDFYLKKFPAGFHMKWISSYQAFKKTKQINKKT